MVMAHNSTKKTTPKNVNDFPPGMAPKMLQMLQTVEQLEETLNPVIAKSHHEMFAKLSPLDKSKMGMLESYAVNSLFWVLMKTSSEDVDEDLKEDYKLEMNRLKEVQSRIAEVEARADRPQINTEVAARFIRRGIGNNSSVSESHLGIEDSPRKREKPDSCESEAFKRSWQ